MMVYSKHTLRVMAIKDRLSQMGEDIGAVVNSNREDWGTIVTVRGDDCYMQVCLSEKGGAKKVVARFPSGREKTVEGFKSDIVHVYDFFDTVRMQRKYIDA